VKLAPIALLASTLLVNATAHAERAFLTHQAADSVSVVELETAELLAKVPVAAAPVGIAIDPIRNRIYATHPEKGLVSVIDSKSYEKNR
jgi:YVTN family beta-propeller protein